MHPWLSQLGKMQCMASASHKHPCIYKLVHPPAMAFIWVNCRKDNLGHCSLVVGMARADLQGCAQAAGAQVRAAVQGVLQRGLEGCQARVGLVLEEAEVGV